MVKRVQRNGRLPSLAVLTLAFWQVRRTWSLLLVILLGMVAAVVIICTVPLLSTVMTTAGLRETVRATPDSGDIVINTETNGISSSNLYDVHEQFGSILQQNIGKYLIPTQSVVLCNDFDLDPSKKAQLVVYGTSLSQAAPYLGQVQGRVARAVPGHTDQIEVMMTPATARQLGMHVGSSFKLTLSYSIIQPEGGEQQKQIFVTAQVAGLFNVTTANASYWHGEDFDPVKFAQENASTFATDTVVVSDQALLSLFDKLASADHADAIHTDNYNGYSLIWHYQLNASLLSSTDLDSLINKLANVQSTMDTQYGYLEQGNVSDAPPSFSFYLTAARITSPVFDANSSSTLEQFRSRIAVASVPSGVFTLLISVFVLFFVSLMTTLLVDRQTEMIVLLGSRGASRGQILGSLLLQTVVMGIFALLIGLLLTFFAVLFLGQHLLPANSQDALNIVTGHPVQAVAQTFIYGLVIVLVTLLTMGFSIFMVARMDVLALRREMARSTVRPFWQRFSLDIVVGIVALACYAFLLYITSVRRELQGDAQVLVTTPLSIIAPFFLIAGCVLLLLRIFPLLLRLGARLAARGRGAVALLALAQIARTPRQSLRMTLLLSMATMFVLFTLLYNATQSQHILDITNYETGADFSVFSNPIKGLPSDASAPYRSLPGVLTASAGYEDQGYGGTANLPVEIRAVDANTFDRAAFWPSQQSFKQADPLFKKLAALRLTKPKGVPVPVIVDQTFADKLQLYVGMEFTLHTQNAYPSAIQCELVGVIDHIPTMAPLLSVDDFAPATTGGIVMDYQTYFNVYQYNAKAQKVPVSQRIVPQLNVIWLHTTDNPVLLAGLRARLNSTTFKISHLSDRRLLLSTLQADPLYLIMDVVLIIGTLTALLLALIGGLLVSWVSARSRMINVVTLRALGGTSEQVTGMFSCEQAIISLTGCALGAIFGLVLAVSVIPSLTLTDLNSNLSSTRFFALQSALSTQLVIPPSLPLLVLAGIALYIAIVIVMVRSVARTNLAQMLRLNED